MNPKLTLIDCAGRNPDEVVARAADESVVRFDVVQAVKIEARALEALHGKNPYSDFVLKYGRRPNQDEAAGMGRMMNMRLRAADGSLQPKLTKAEKAAWKRFSIKAKAIEARQKLADMRRLYGAVCDLTAIAASPSELVGEVGQREVISARVKVALDYLSRFAKELQRRETGEFPGAR
jgi:hypothetical protein